MNIVNPGRVRRVTDGVGGHGPVVYWMSRDQRARDNWALLHARERAQARSVPVVVAFCLSQTFLGATLRQYDFMLRGLRETAGRLRALNIPFALLHGAAPEVLPSFLHDLRASELVTDFDPLRVKRGWLREVAAAAGMPVHEVDAHNVVPARLVSERQEYAARTIRPKIHRLLSEFLEPFPELSQVSNVTVPYIAEPDFEEALRWIRVDATVAPVALPAGEDAAEARLLAFIAEGLSSYAEGHSDPNVDGTSGLSPYLHFGQLAPQRAALAAAQARHGGEGREAFLEQLVVRRELTDNFCLYNDDYDALSGAPAWALATLDAHRADPRPHVYTREQFEAARTHSPLWNAAQHELVTSGTMHNYMRMYWAKKILEWSATPEDALATALHLNDRYQLDGRDPNGYVGVIWSIAGVHDRPWKERPVFGSIRYMNSNGCRRKFDVEAYIRARSAAPRQLTLV
ncbi:deoxyribodipyrimidine photo-lyase [Desulfobaculum xiamenense]|uniref:Deoxyribodipyrimidine photo-lyase n=1 Tax=Desulfobaculum xiamenense TaxID=995050 RepID=A0A846QP14_9BACT|nr:deoxyribodipyrimidine photo-lyase [Desulfobaculum xiamenense]